MYLVDEEELLASMKLSAPAKTTIAFCASAYARAQMKMLIREKRVTLFKMITLNQTNYKWRATNTAKKRTRRQESTEMREIIA